MKSINYFLTLFILLKLSALSQLLSNPIITRHDVDDSKYIQLAKKYPEINSLFFINKTDMAGTLIARNWVLSAAHVAADLSIGDSIVSVNKKKYLVSGLHIHPYYNDNQAYDLALIKIDMESDIIPIVPIYTNRNEFNKIVIIAGNGDRGTGLSGPTGNDNIIRAAMNRIEEVTDFWLKWDFDNPEVDSIEVSELEGISGPGDSSGPAFIIVDGRGCLAGVSSGQSTRASNGKEGVYGVREYYVRVSSYVDWINSILSKK